MFPWRGWRLRSISAFDPVRILPEHRLLQRKPGRVSSIGPVMESERRCCKLALAVTGPQKPARLLFSCAGRSPLIFIEQGSRGDE